MAKNKKAVAAQKVLDKVNKPKKPTAADLGVTQVVGSRGKVRSENPAPLVPPGDPCDVLKDWAEWSGRIGAETARARRLASTFRQLGNMAPGSYGRSWDTGGEVVEVLEQFNGCATKVRRGDKVEMLSQGADMEIIPAEEVRTKLPPAPTAPPGTKAFEKQWKEINKTGAKEVTEKPTRVVKSRGDGWNGYSGSALGRWMGAQGWDKETAAKALKALGLDGVAEKSIPTLLKAGKDGSRPVPTLSAEHADEVNRAGGKIVVKEASAEEPKKTRKPKAK